MKQAAVVVSFILGLLLFTTSLWATPSCVGAGVSSCSGVGATSATCGNYYLNGGSTMTQCGWNGSYCSNSGPTCLPGGKPACTATITSSCGAINSNPPCTTNYLASGTQCRWNSNQSTGPLGCVNGAACTPPPKCSGKAVSSCSGANATSSTCSGFYIGGSKPMQCKWNGSYCSNGGGLCT